MLAAESASSTYSSMGRPSTGISTLGRSDFIRVPSPAAKTTAMASSMIVNLFLVGHCSQQGSRGFGAIFGRHDGAADGDAREAGGEDLVQVFGFDAAYGESGQRNLGRDLLEETDAGKPLEVLGAGGKHGTAANVVSAVEDGLA